MDITYNADLRPFNTFGIGAQAKALGHFTTADEAQELLAHARQKELEILILGGGSNLLFTRDHPGLVMINNVPGIEIIGEDDLQIVLRAGAGVVWHELVLHCVKEGYGGIENMSLIPGKVGASPMQNIGAYGVELKDVFVRLHALHRESGEVKEFNAEECAFGYRESYFKRQGKDQWIILSVDLKLSKDPVINTSYGSIAQELESMEISEPTIKDVSQAVINIRSSKLPDPKQIGNAGSFFKNPVIETKEYERIRQAFPDVVGYPAGEGFTKLAAGWLIEHAGWKGYRDGEYGVHDKQALVLVNHGDARGESIKSLSEEIMNSISAKFGVHLEREVNIF